jgi:hypothetical protein
VSAKFNWMLERELTGLRYSYEEAGPIIEDLDPFGWGGTCRPLPSRQQRNRESSNCIHWDLAADRAAFNDLFRGIPVSKKCVRSIDSLRRAVARS